MNDKFQNKKNPFDYWWIQTGNFIEERKVNPKTKLVNIKCKEILTISVM